MTASFFWALGGQGKDPLDAITLLDDKRAKRHLQEHFAFPPESFALPRGDALLMSGTTDDLRGALQSDIDKGLKEIRVEGLMAVWYVRCKHRLKDITVVSIASLQGYWGLKLNDPDNSSGYRWLRLYQGHTLNGGVTLNVLANDLLVRAKGVKSWELDRAEVTGAEGFLRSLTPPGLAMSPIPDPNPNNPVRLVGDIPVLFNDAAKQATINKANQFIRDPNFPVRTQNGFPTVVEQFMKDVGRCEVRVGGDRARGTLLQATGVPDPRVMLRQFTGSDQAALNLSRFVNQDVIHAILTTGWKAVVPQIVPRLTAGKVPSGNTKTQFITVQVEGRGLVIDYEIHTLLSGFTDNNTFIQLDEDKSWLKASMQIFVGAGALAQPNLTDYSYNITKPPEVALHTEMTMASLNQQAG